MAELRVVTKTVPDGVVLTLTSEEANALAKCVGATAGNAREIETLWTLLHEAGFSGEGFVSSKNTAFRVDRAGSW